MTQPATLDEIEQAAREVREAIERLQELIASRRQASEEDES